MAQECPFARSDWLILLSHMHCIASNRSAYSILLPLWPFITVAGIEPHSLA